MRSNSQQTGPLVRLCISQQTPKNSEGLEWAPILAHFVRDLIYKKETESQASIHIGLISWGMSANGKNIEWLPLAVSSQYARVGVLLDL